MLESGTLLQDRFLIEERIGSGGMGAVYLAIDQKFGSRVAIKETFYGNRELADAFEREARLLNSLHHPVLPHVSDYFSDRDDHFLVMEYIEGEDLSEILKRGERIEIDDVIRWTYELLDALDYLHSQQPPIIHRDIKPNNLKVTSRGNIVLLDFGLAKETSGNTLGMESVFGYSRKYSPLEQIEGTGTDTRSDLFSLGATMFHLLTGKPPVDVLTRASALVAGRPDPLPLATDLKNEVPESFAFIIRSALALDPNQRFVSAAAMRTALDSSLGESVRSEAEAPATPAEELDQPEDLPNEFAALEAFRSAGEASPVAPAAPIGEMSDPGQPLPVRVIRPRRSGWVRPAVLMSAFLLIASVLGYGIYRSGENVDNQESSAVPPVGIDPPVSAAEVATPVSAEPPPTEVEQPKEELVAERSAKKDSGSESRVPRPEPVRKPATAPRAVSRPRPNETVQQRQAADRTSRQVPVSSIEMIMTGRPAGGDRPRRVETNRERRRLVRENRRGEWPY